MVDTKAAKKCAELLRSGANCGLTAAEHIDGLAAVVERVTATEKRPSVVCLCGSTRFSVAFREANLAETLAGKIVLSIGCDTRSGSELFAKKTPEELAELLVMLTNLHMKKIDMADEVLILNVGGYIGESTARERDYAVSLGKPVRYLEPI